MFYFLTAHIIKVKKMDSILFKLLFYHLDNEI